MLKEADLPTFCSTSLKPTAEKTSTELSVALILNTPFASAMAVVLVPLTLTETEGMGSPYHLLRYRNWTYLRNGSYRKHSNATTNVDTIFFMFFYFWGKLEERM